MNQVGLRFTAEQPGTEGRSKTLKLEDTIGLLARFESEQSHGPPGSSGTMRYV